jgi:uncharacterized protein YndB with AHSA1/START domain
MNDDSPNTAAYGHERATGRLERGGARPSVRLEHTLAEPPADVWWALTDPEGLTSWFPTEIHVDAWRAGAKLLFVFPGHAEYTMGGVVLACDEPRLLAYTWGEETLRFELTPTAVGGTLVVLHDEPAPGIAARSAAGWQLCLERLAGNIPPGHAWRSLFAQYTAAFEPELGPQEGPPEGFADQA